jgi:hypothetical protein
VGLGNRAKEALDRCERWYLVLLVSAKEGAVFSREEIQSHIDQGRWGLAKDQQYKVNWPLPTGRANWFKSAEQFLAHLK